MKALIALLIPALFPRFVVDGEGGGAADPGAGAGAGAPGADQGAAAEPSLRDTLEASMEISEKGEDATDLSAAARRLASARKGSQPKQDTVKAADDQNTVKASDDAKAKRDAERAAMTPEQRAAAEAEDKRKADEAKAASAVEAPAHWPAAAREMFAKQSPEAKQWLLERHKAMEADYTKKMQEITGARREAEELDEIFKPWKQQMDLQGITRPQAIRQLAAAHKRLQEDPVGGMKWLAENYGIDLKSLVDGAAAADPAGESPTVKALRQQVEQLTGQITKITGQQSEQQNNAVLTQVQQFAEEKDAQGQPLRPYFDDVAKDVANLIRVSKLPGETPLTLQQAYDKAIYANETVRAKVLQANDAKRRADEEAERKRKADAAKKAGFDVRGEGAASDTVAKTDGSIRGDLEAAFASHGGRV